VYLQVYVEINDGIIGTSDGDGVWFEHKREVRLCNYSHLQSSVYFLVSFRRHYLS
jgi:hypothetical protein